MKFLYVLSEGNRDDIFYERICERATGISFSRTEEFRYRPGDNYQTVRKLAKLLLNKVKHWQGPQDVAVVIALDNDRAPGHPGSVESLKPLPNYDRKKQPRYPELAELLKNTLGNDRKAWPVDVALAVPVEMIESWVLLLWNPERNELPLFAEAGQKIACDYHGGKAPPQLKDLCKEEAGRHHRGDLTEFFWAAAENNLEAAEAVSPSFKLFLNEVRQWRRV